MVSEEFKEALGTLGRIMKEIGSCEPADLKDESFPGNSRQLVSLVHPVNNYNPWFIPEFVQYSLKAWGIALEPEKIEKWLSGYTGKTASSKSPKTVGLVMAGNLPMVGLHDLLCVLASGNRALVKLSREDNKLIPALAGILVERMPELQTAIVFTEGPLKGMDAVIATGSNNTSRYFEYYFGKYPNIIRRNRNGTAVITGHETPEWYRLLADDIFIHFGLGCRNVSKLYLPEKFDPASLFDHFSNYGFLSGHNKYCNNYDYQKSIFLINRIEFFDNGFALLRQHTDIPSPLSVIHFEHYSDMSDLQAQLLLDAEKIQCIVTQDDRFTDRVMAGRTQQPELWDYADGIDTMDFLLNL
jgi:hypothetical protein